MILYYWLVGILPLVQHPLWGRSVGPLTIFEYLGVCCLIYAVVHTLAKGKLPPLFSSWEMRLFVFLYVLGVVSTLFKGRGFDLTNGPFIIYTSSLSLILITVCVVDTVNRLRWTILVLIGSYAFGSLYVIREWQVLRAAHINARPGWIVGDSNYFATASVYAIALALYFLRTKGPFLERAYCFICLPVVMFANTTCASRGGFLGLVVTCLFLVWQTKNRLRNLLLVATFVLPLSLLMPVSPLHRFLDHKADLGSTDAHLAAWQAGLSMIKEHPIFGIGLGNFKPMMPLYLPSTIEVDTLAHNMFIEVAAELGLPAGFIFLSIFVTAFMDLGRVRKDESSPHYLREAAVALRAGLAGSAVAGCFVSAEYQKTTWMGFALVACLTPIARSLKPAAEDQTDAERAVQSSIAGADVESLGRHADELLENRKTYGR